MTHCFRLVAAGLFLAALAGCSSFNGEYKTAVAGGVAPDSVEGPWEGRWLSNAGHGGGELRALLTKTSPNTYSARFRATYWGIFQADEDTLLRVTSTSPIKASGESDLGALKGGMYKYEVTLTPTNFDATYQSEDDRGEFHLTRPMNK
jgi:hypothetical protein